MIELNELAAGRFAVKHEIRGLDAIHLEAALSARQTGGNAPLAFSSYFNPKLNRAAAAEGLRILGAG